MKPGLKDALWMVLGAVLLLAILLVILHFQKTQSPAAPLVWQARRLELVNQMRLSLASAAEAEKSAVLAITDEDSQKFADQARAAAAMADRARRELEAALATGGSAGERSLLAQFTQEFTEFRRIDQEVLGLAVQNTNLKASSLADGPAATALNAMDVALARLTPGDLKVSRLADQARIAAWRLLTLIPPHIAEESDQKMDELEAQMAGQDRLVRRSLQGLAALPGLADNPDLKTAGASYARFSETKAQILKLSRANTNVRSLAISLSQERKVTLVCQATLAALQQVVAQEPIAGVTSRRPVNPR